MSKRQARAQASSAKAATATFGSGFSSSSSAVFGASSSPLTYVSEPPDLSSISDPRVVVLFRNLSKRDSTTKAKALEELQTYIASLKAPVEEGVLEAWIKMYPRTSIDNSKSVRQNSHALMGQIAASAGKRVARHMPKVVGAWLCGLYDTDKSVVEATLGALRQVFNTPEKVQNIRRAYQQPILEYCRDAIDHETPLTLSDERTVSPDDAEAKYSRVISACLALVGSLLSNLSGEEIGKFQEDYDMLLRDKKVWGFASHSDASIRRATHRFLKLCLETQEKTLGRQLELLSKSYLANGLSSDQTSSACEYLSAITQLGTKFPAVWTETYSSKTPVAKRLRQFLKKGSQSAPASFWKLLVDFFASLPKQALPQDGAAARELLGAAYDGVTRKDEPRVNQNDAFKAFLQVVKIVTHNLAGDELSTELRQSALPTVSNFLRPPPQPYEGALRTDSIEVVSTAAGLHGMDAILQQAWPEYTQYFVDQIKTSAPEQSQDYKKSQDALINTAERFAALQSKILDAEQKSSESLRATLTESTASILSVAMSVVETRNGKPYGAAAVIAKFISRKAIGQDSRIQQDLEKFVRENISELILSPSSSYLISVLYSMVDSTAFKAVWDDALETALGAEDSPAKTTAVDALLTFPGLQSLLDDSSAGTKLLDYIKSRVQGALQGSVEWSALNGVLQAPVGTLPSSATDEILSSVTKSLSLSGQAPSAVEGLSHIVKQNPDLLKAFLSSPSGSHLLQSLLLVSESPDEELAQEAVSINASLQALLGAESASNQTIQDVIHRGLREASSTSVSVETLVDLAKQLVRPAEKSQADGTGESKANIFPRLQDWDMALAPFLDLAPRHSLAVTSRLAGAVYLIPSSSAPAQAQRSPRDANGYSPAYRMALYLVKLLQDADLFAFAAERLPLESQRHILNNLSLSAQLASDNLGLAGSNNLWAVYNPEVETEAMTFISEAHDIVTRLQEKVTELQPTAGWLEELSSKTDVDTSANAYYNACVRSSRVSDWVQTHGPQFSATEAQEVLKNLRKNKDTLWLLAALNDLGEPLAAMKTCERMCNELVADLTGVKIDSRPEEGLRQLLVLNAIFYGQKGVTESIAKQRVIFFVKHVVPWLQDLELPLAVRAETCKALTMLLPLMGDIYGEHWGTTLSALASSWQKTADMHETQNGRDSPIPYAHASLKLYGSLRSLTTSEDPNDDLLEAWKEHEQDVARGLLNLLNHSQHFPDDFHQPLKIVNELLARHIAKLPLKLLESTEELYPLLYVESQHVQQTAFDLLHKQIAAAQEQISIDTALERTTARLPEELLSLILEAPTVAALADASFERSMPLPLRGYLLSWLLVFDHLEHASFKVKSDYIEHLKEGDYLSGLLSFTFDFLGHSSGKTADVSKLDITTYVPDTEPPLRDTQWLLTHLYFLCLKHIPSLTRAWAIDCKSRPVVIALHPWTEKYVSPPVISAALAAVTEWAKQHANEDPDSPFSVKVNTRASEITASYLIDDAVSSIRISLPPAFPLASPAIEGLQRVAVDERKWEAWLRTSRGAMTIFNAGLIDALTMFKKNVEGAMKGQVECAICYSVVGEDRRVPDKRCSVCKNLFHKNCLFKWFKSSGGSSCPLCRNAFHYG